MFSINDLAELNVLRQCLYVFKFGKEEDVVDLINSPLYGRVFERVNRALEEELIKLSHSPNVIGEQLYIEHREHERQVVESYLERLNNWSDFDFNTKRKVVINLLIPYKYSKSTIDEMIEYADFFHSK